MEKNFTIEQKAREIAKTNSSEWRDQEDEYISSEDDCYDSAMAMADFVIDKAIDWLQENVTDYLDKIEDCTGGNEWESQTWSFPEEFFTRFKQEIKNGDE